MENPTDADVLLQAIRGQLALVHTTIPGRVLSYDRTTQTATVQPVIKSRYRDARTRNLVAYLPSALANVPVAWPASNGLSITWPLAAGDPVILLFAERSLDEWKTVTGTQHEPRDVRRFDISDAIALPGGYSPASAIPAAGYSATAMVIRATLIQLGSSAATAFVALASLVDARISTIVTAYNTHTHSSSIGPTGPPVTPLGAQATVAATKVMAE